MWKSVRDWESVRVCVYTESTHFHEAYSKLDAQFHFMWTEMWLRGIDVWFAQWDVLSYGLKSHLIVLSKYNNVLLAEQSTVQSIEQNWVESHQVTAEVANIQCCKMVSITFLTLLRMNLSCDYWIWHLIESFYRNCWGRFPFVCPIPFLEINRFKLLYSDRSN